MARKQAIGLSAEEKLRIVEEGRQTGATVSEVCRRHQLDHAQFYRWERLARQGALEALRNGVKQSRSTSHEEKLASEVNRLRAVVTELIAENLTLKKGFLV
jgi:transposase-like protein